MLSLPAADLASALTGPSAQLLQESFLPKFVQTQRWFGAKSRTLKDVCIEDVMPIGVPEAAILLLRIVYTDGPGDMYTLPVAVVAHERSSGRGRVSARPGSIIAPMQMGAAGGGALVDATILPEVRRAASLIDRKEQIQTRCEGSLAGKPSSSFSQLRGVEDLPSRRGSAEQSNTSLLYDGKLILKLFRRLQTGENPDAEIGRFLTESPTSNTSHPSRVSCCTPLRRPEK